MCTLWNSISYFLFKECTYVNLYESLTGWESWWVFLSSPPSFDGFGGQHIGVDRTLIKSGTVSYTRGVLLPRGCLLAACFTGTSPRAASSSSHVVNACRGAPAVQTHCYCEVQKRAQVLHLWLPTWHSVGVWKENQCLQQTLLPWCARAETWI